MSTLELTWMSWIQMALRSSWLDRIMSFFTLIGDYGIIWILLTIVLLMYPKTRKIGTTLMIALLLMLIINNGILKYSIARIRPCGIMQDLELLITCPSSYSFPSGHTSSSFAAAGVLWLMPQVKRHWKWIGLFVAVMISLSRVYLFVHFPTDIVVGALVGWGIAFITVRWLMPQIAQRKKI